MPDYTFPPRLEPVPSVPPLNELLKPSEAAARLGVSIGTLRNWRHALTGPAYYRVDGVRYWTRDLDTWLVSRRVDHGTSLDVTQRHRAPRPRSIP